MTHCTNHLRKHAGGRLAHVCGSLIALPGLAVAGPAMADTASNTMQVSATVVDSCTIAATPMNFGMLTGAAGSPTATATVSLSCAPQVDYNVAMDAGLNARGRNRQMLNPVTGDLLRYQIYRDATLRSPWSDRRFQTVSGTTGPTGQAELTAYGEIPSLTGISSTGSYHDTIVVTVNF